MLPLIKMAKTANLIAGERPNLSRRGCNLCNNSTYECNDYDSGHDVGADIAVGRVIEELNKGILGGSIKYCRRIGYRKAQCKNCQVSKDDIEDYSPKDGSWKGIRSVSDLFSCIQLAVLASKEPQHVETYKYVQRSQSQA